MAPANSKMHGILDDVLDAMLADRKAMQVAARVLPAGRQKENRARFNLRDV